MKKRKPVSALHVISSGLIHLELTIVAILILFPVVWIIGSSFGSSSSLINASAIPKNPSLNNYVWLFTHTDYKQWYVNTLKIAVINMLLSVLLSSVTAYAFSRFAFRGKKVGLLTMLVMQMFPSFMGMSSIYILFLSFNLLDNHWGLILIYATGQIPYNTWLMKGYLKNIPFSLDEAAMLDGAGRGTILLKIILPISLPMLTFVAVSQFMAPWMDFILPRLLIRSNDKKTLAVGLFEMIDGNTNNNFTAFAAGSVLVAVPITILYIVLQRYLIQGVASGANKE